MNLISGATDAIWKRGSVGDDLVSGGVAAGLDRPTVVD